MTDSEHFPEDGVPRCPSCGHFARHHESYPYLDGVLCKTRKDRAWCDCSLAVDQVTEALLAQGKAALLREIESEMLSRIGARMVSNDYMDLMFALRARAEAFEQRTWDGPRGNQA